MDLNFTSQELAFREEVRSFLNAKMPTPLMEKVRDGKHLSKADQEEWHAVLNAQGWLANHWPKEHGGTGWTAVEKFIFENECCLANAPRTLPFGLSMLGPVLIKYGNDEQKKYWLPRILKGQDWWCQGYSEPGAGSDLAAVKTTAVRDGDDYIVNGQKTWTTLGQYANMIFCLVRTNSDGKKQEGISFLLIDMNSPGVELRPIKTIDGGYEVNEIFLSDVRVPARNLVGEEHKGWTYVKYLLTYERTNIAGVGFSVASMEKLKKVAKDQKKNGKRLADDPVFAARMAKVEIDLENMKTTNLRVISAVAGGGVPGAESSMLKVKGTEIRQELNSLTRRALGNYARPYVPGALEEGFNGDPVGPDYANPIATQYFNNRKLSIFGGSNEIQKNIISKMILEL